MDKKYILARNLRKQSTSQEEILWKLLRNRQFSSLKFRRQYPIGKYIVDFVCVKKKLIIELDGGQHNFDKNIEYDNQRTQFLENLGYTVIRFWNNDIDNNLDDVIMELEKYC